jgi:type IV pilus assembly protein PilZ
VDDSGDAPATNREHGRRPIELKVAYKRLNSFFSDYTKNISKGGTFIKTGKPLEAGTEFIFELHVPSMVEPLRIVGRVQWVVTQGDIDAGASRGATEPGMGIRFVYRRPEDKIEIERKVEKVMIDSMGQLLYSKLMDQSHQSSERSSSSAGPAAPEATERSLTGYGSLMRDKQEES